MGKRKRGRKKGSRNKGYFFRPKRGWFLVDTNGKFVPLCYQDGQRIRDQDNDSQVVREAYQWYLALQKEGKQQASGTSPNPITVQEGGSRSRTDPSRLWNAGGRPVDPVAHRPVDRRAQGLEPRRVPGIFNISANEGCRKS